jgi:hypothetical protein
MAILRVGVPFFAFHALLYIVEPPPSSCAFAEAFIRSMIVIVLAFVVVVCVM